MESGATLKGAVASILAGGLPDGDVVSLAYFVNGSAVHSDAVTVDDSTRLGLADLTRQLPARGSTCTGCGLRLARQILPAAQNRSTVGSLVVLLSDGRGEQSSFSLAEDFSPAKALREAGVFVNTVAVGLGVPADLERLAKETGGRAYAIPDNHAATPDGRRELIDAILDGTDSMSSLVGTETSSDKATAAHGPRGGSLLRVRSGGGPCAHEPVVLRARVPWHVREPSSALLMASLTKGLCPVVRAAARALASFGEDGTRQQEQFTLHDTGLGEDAYANDGIYTGQFTKFRGKGRYRIVIEMRNRSDTAFLDWTSAQAFQRNSSGPKESLSTGAFLETSAGQPLVVLEALKEVQVPPGRVRDLSAALQLTGNRPAVRLSWTAPGSHAFQGSANSLDIRASRSAETMLDSFNNATVVSDVLFGSLQPAAAFHRQEVTAALPPSLLADSFPEVTASRNVYFALVAVNEDGLRSELSNIASVFLPATAKPRAGTDAGSSEVDVSVTDTAESVNPESSGAPTGAPELPTVNEATSLESKDTSAAVVETDSSKENTDVHSQTAPHADAETPIVPSAPVETDSSKGNTDVLHPQTAPQLDADTSAVPSASVNVSGTEGNETAPSAGESKAAVNKEGQEEEDDSTTRAWILFGAFLLACLLICANLAFLYCRAQYEVDDGPPSPGSTATMTVNATDTFYLGS